MKITNFKYKLFAFVLMVVFTVQIIYVPEAFANSVNLQNRSENKNASNIKPEGNNGDNSKYQNTNNIIPRYSDKEIIVKFKNEKNKNKTEENIKSKLNLNQFTVKKEFKNKKIKLYEIGENDNLESTIASLKTDSNIEYAQPNYSLSVEEVPLDSKFIEQWGLNNSGSTVHETEGRKGVDINVLPAWDITMGNEEVVIGILDSGIDINHTDLKSNIYTNVNEIPNNNIDDDKNGYIDDINGWDFINNDNTVYDTFKKDIHGTAIAGIIAASSNEMGITGVAPNVRLLPLKFINETTGYTSDAIEAIEYAKDRNIRIINCSFGGTEDNLALNDAMESSEILFICAAGNNGLDTKVKPIYPAAFDLNNIISVTAIDSKGLLTFFSNYGDDVDVAAPGLNILSTLPGDGKDYNNQYKYYNGTSMSTAFVSGIAH